ncbi:MAG: hypothetical protein KH989_08625 [Kocuria rhizophila]|nr:hypothetical protein [Kocuria rhizophila]
MVGRGPSLAVERRAAQGEGLELVERLAEGGGTRTWLAREQSTREGFTVTFAVSEDPERRRPVEADFAALVDAWAQETHPALVGVRAVIADGTIHRNAAAPAGGSPRGGGVDRGALVAEHVKARPLAEIMGEQGRVAPETLLPVLADAARGLSRLHERGWVHGALSARHVLVTPDGRALLDGYGVRAGARPGPPAWGQAQDTDARQELADRAVGLGRAHHHMDEAGPVAAGSATEVSAAQDVHDLAVTGWLALTGRYPGPDAHRVPLSLMCPNAPRHLVLMLEGALCDDPAQRPSAHELATGFDTPVRKPSPARRPPERMTPEVIRADGTVLRPRRRPFAAAALRLGGRSERSQGRGGERARTVGQATAGTAATDGESHGPRRALAITAAVLAAAAIVWVFANWPDGDVVAGTGATASPAAPEDARSPDEARGFEVSANPSGTSGAGGNTDESASRDAGGTGGGSPRQVAPSASGGSSAGTGTAPGESMQDKDREARGAVGDLVARRAAALAAGDEAAAEAVYVPRSGLAARDKDLIRRAAARGGADAGTTELSELRMKVVSLAEQKPDTAARLSPADAARTRTYNAEVVTRGWRGALPTGSAVTGDGDLARQRLRITITATAQGWRLADVTPLTAPG